MRSKAALNDAEDRYESLLLELEELPLGDPREKELQERIQEAKEQMEDEWYIYRYGMGAYLGVSTWGRC
jgi:hypothetical protein